MLLAGTQIPPHHPTRPQHMGLGDGCCTPAGAGAGACSLWPGGCFPLTIFIVLPLQKHDTVGEVGAWPAALGWGRIAALRSQCPALSSWVNV